MGIRQARDASITSTDVYNIDKERINKLARLDEDQHKSLKEWARKLREKGFSVFEYERLPDGSWAIQSSIGTDDIFRTQSHEMQEANGVEKTLSEGVLPEDLPSEVSTDDNNGQTTSRHGQAAMNRVFGFGFMSPWQRGMLQQFGTAFGLDSTHGTANVPTELYTAVVSHSTGKGIPTAFLLTSDRSSIALGHWLAHIRDHLMHNDGSGNQSCMLKTVVIDDSNIEKNAITRAFGLAVNVQLCLWHVQRSWSRQLLQKFKREYQTGVKSRSCMKGNGKHKDDAVPAPIVNREAVLAALRAIMYQNNQLVAEQFVKNLQRELGKTPAHCPVLDYLNDNYFSGAKMKEWMRCYRRDVYWADINTNNYVESWHSNLKKHFLRDNKRPRLDYLVYILSGDAVR
ncbi:hypothetical protein BGX28_001507, partial [Mortierella sp. GBA30]